MEPGQRVFRGKNKSADAGEKPRRKTGFPSHDLSRELLYTQPDSAFTAACILTLIVAPLRMSPAISVLPEFQAVRFAASVRTVHTVELQALMSVSASENFIRSQ